MELSKALTKEERVFDYKVKISELLHIQSYDYTLERDKLIANYKQQIAYENRPSAFRGCNY
ncbi:hypothetical protein PQE75_gp052 [Bacillus phage vB_BcoS-136]|uniref:Uncharacterized protein n=1 Tax=Bacillus phage vB_BcoS-136 TaxID=2419619 RepID=A0A3G3BVE2_9CAUD|nr:hypothetical protein PQE75_gp052 [Bacillus phage vB_BcoS-136]AYP68184.1 hypothetical protein vBBcoS136_00052 [Bacillus phage vB_BcoS-136]